MRIPLATYRVQFRPSFTLEDGARLLPYLCLLGISDLYASPIFQARKGSPHGYDLVDPRRINPELGGPSGMATLAAGLKRHAMGLLQDFVPNHTAFSRENRMLADLLEKGPGSGFFRFFDIDWDHPYPGLHRRLLAPFLGGFYGETLEEGGIKVDFDRDGFSISYYDFSLPVRLDSYPWLLAHRWEDLEERLGEDQGDLLELSAVLSRIESLASLEEEEVRGQAALAKRTLWDLFTRSEAIRAHIAGILDLLNRERKTQGGPPHLDKLLSEQFFRLSFWKVATEEINYRRFFSINDLISLRVEEPEVFEHVHALLLRLVEEGKVSALRIDHIDGLYDPGAYLRRLRDKTRDTYTIVEKILGRDEALPRDWPVEGTTGYDFMNALTGLFCRTENEGAFTRVYRAFTRQRTQFDELLREKKRLILERHMTGDIDNLAHQLQGLSGRDPFGSDITLYGLKNALAEVMAAFPVYRTYVSRSGASERDRATITEALEAARERNPGLRYELDFLGRSLLQEGGDHLSGEENAERLRFVMRFQQFTGPLMAKGLEDTTFYLFNRLLSLNEVGGSPERFGFSPEDFHRFVTARARHWPHTLNATSTHDTKRGEDVRARISVLSEIPSEWDARLKEWGRINRRKKRAVKGLTAPDRNDEYFLYQTLLGAFPFHEEEYAGFRERMQGYIIKAIREAKVHTAWLKPDTAYEEACLSFLDSLLDPSGDGPFLKVFLPFQRKIAYYGIFNSLSQVLIKIAAPGIPDFYQGTELWDLNLVDPDNRRPVDFATREAMLRRLWVEAGNDPLGLAERVLASPEDGRVKLFLTHRALEARREMVSLFRQGRYLPLAVTGKWRDHLIAFARNQGEEWAAAVAPRFLVELIREGEAPVGKKVWQDTAIVLPPGAPEVWKDAITGRQVTCKESFAAGDVLKSFPVSLMIAEGSKGRGAAAGE